MPEKAHFTYIFTAHSPNKLGGAIVGTELTLSKPKT